MIFQKWLKEHNQPKMKARSFRPVIVSVCGCLLGLIVGIVAQVKHVRDIEREHQLIAEEFERRGQSPPLLTDMLKPWAYPIELAAIFGLLGVLLYLGYYWFVTRPSNET
jgi:hypothetical protein